jgi:hypothetical protein
MMAVEKRRDQERDRRLLGRHRCDRKAKLQRARLHSPIERCRTRKLEVIVFVFLSQPVREFQSMENRVVLK